MLSAVWLPSRRVEEAGRGGERERESGKEAVRGRRKKVEKKRWLKGGQKAASLASEGESAHGGQCAAMGARCVLTLFAPKSPKGKVGARVQWKTGARLARTHSAEATVQRCTQSVESTLQILQSRFYTPELALDGGQSLGHLLLPPSCPSVHSDTLTTAALNGPRQWAGRGSRAARKLLEWRPNGSRSSLHPTRPSSSRL